MSDGRVEIDTSLDTSGLKEGLGKIGNVVGATAKTIGALGAAGVAATASLTKSSLSAYASYEQLTGGIETLFKDSSDLMMTYAKDAYKTAGISQNEYMETVTSFSASLIKSVEEAGGSMNDAVGYADTAIRDMSDNANKMGSSMESIQNAYQGFAKQNYTMLDNLKLGYGGTKSEMERLIEDANKLREEQGLNADLTIDSYADIVTAIHEVQTEMGITGTTAEEASTTIEGSVKMVKASWQDLLVGIADDNADFDTLLDNFVTSVGLAGENILPRIEQILNGIGKLVGNLAPIIIEKLPKLIKDITPQLVSASSDLIKIVAKTLPKLIPTIVQALIEIGKSAVDGLIEVFPEIWDAFKESLNSLLDELGVSIDLDGIFSSIEGIVQGFFDNVLPIIETSLGIIQPLLEVLGDVLDTILKVLSDIMNNETAVVLIISIATAVGLVVAAMQAWALAQTVLNAVMSASPITWIIVAIVALIAIIVLIIVYFDEIKEAMQQVWDKVKEVFTKIGDFIVGIWDSIKNKFTEVWDAIVVFITETIPNKFKELKDTIVQIFIDIKDGIKEKVNAVSETISEIWTSIKEGFQEVIDSALTWGKDMIDNFVKGIKDKAGEVTSAVKGIGREIKNFLGFSEPEKGPLSNFHTFSPDMIDLWCQGIDQNKYKVQNTVEDMANIINTGINSNDALFSTSDAISGGYGSPIININQPIATVDELADEFNVMNKYGLIRA